MGWDAYANITKGHIDKFRTASQRVLDKADSVDCLLSEGGLDCSACAYQLEHATGLSAWNEYGWTAEQVKNIAKHAYWLELEDHNKDEWWTILSAKEFLETCAEVGTGIHFSY